MDQLNFFNLLWSIPLQIGISIFLLWQQLGIATLGGLLVMILLMPVNAVFAIFLRKYQVNCTDHSSTYPHAECILNSLVAVHRCCSCATRTSGQSS